MTTSATSPITHVSGRSIAVRGNDIDTDRIIPARFLKCVTFDTLGPHAFEDDRLALKAQGKTHAFDMPQFAGAGILLANKNFGCGSSREHAPQSLKRWGIKAIVAESFAEIFYGNCVSLGIPCVILSEAEIEKAQILSEANPKDEWSLNIQTGELKSSQVFKVQMKDSVRVQFIEGTWNPAYDLLKNMDNVRILEKALPY